MVRLGLLGAGRIGQIHGRNARLSDEATLVAVADAVPEAAATLAGRLGVEVRDVDAIFEASDIDAVLICSSTDTHADFIDRAAQAGKAVFCEKPVDLSAERIVRTLETVEAAAVPLMIGFNRRFDPNLVELERRLRDGAIGPIEIVTIVSRDPGPPPIAYIERSGGLFRDMMIHDFDLARFLLAEEPVEVRALGSCLVDPSIGEAGDVDTALVQMRTAAGRLCQISCSRRASYGYDQRVEVHGAKGMLRVGNVHTSTVELAGASGFTTDPALNFFLERYAEAYRRELDAFLRAVKDGSPPTPSGEDGLRAQRLADAATESARSGQAVAIG